jgi:hypothetical protein
VDDSTRSNSHAEIQALVGRCGEALARGRRGGLESLLAFREAGTALRALKEVLPRGQFGPIAEQRCGCSKQWRARLMLLDREWPNIETALGWARGSGRQVDGKAYSVDGALAILRQWRRSQLGTGGRTSTAKPQKQSSACEFAKLKDRLSAAKAYIVVLEEQLQLGSGEPQEIDESTRIKLEKIAALLNRGGSGGERVSAADKLFGTARALGWTPSTLLQECGIEGPADWTS